MGKHRLATVVLSLGWICVICEAAYGCSHELKLEKPVISEDTGGSTGSSASGAISANGGSGDAVSTPTTTNTGGTNGNKNSASGGNATTVGAAGSSAGSAALDSGIGIKDSGVCGGCIDPKNGKCYPGIDAQNCGKIGAPCTECASEQTCVEGKCASEQPDASACNGCVGNYSGNCYPGTDSFHCGTEGALCTMCTLGQSCVEGACTEIETDAGADGGTADASTCEGCIGRTSGNCYPGDTADHCGIDGELCNTCTEGQSCIDNSCQ